MIGMALERFLNAPGLFHFSRMLLLRPLWLIKNRRLPETEVA